MIKQSHFTVKRLVTAALLAGAYTAISLCLAPLSFGAVQVRAAEALTLLPVLGPTAIWGVTLGCAITNAIGAAMGINFAIDILVGTAATLLAAVLSYLLREKRIMRLPVLSALCPVIVNALFLGVEFTVLEMGWNSGLFLFNALSVGAGELLSCGILGLLLISVIERQPALRRAFGV